MANDRAFSPGPMGARGSHAGHAAASSVGLDEVRAATAVGLDVDCDAVLGRAVPPVPGLEQARAVRAGALLILTRSKFGKYLSKGWRAAAGTSLSLIISSISSQRSVRVDVDLSPGALVRPLDLEGGRDLVFGDPGSGDLHVRGRLRRACGAFRVPIQTMTHVLMEAAESNPVPKLSGGLGPAYARGDDGQSEASRPGMTSRSQSRS
jgi:hypothetical protein